MKLSFRGFFRAIMPGIVAVVIDKGIEFLNDAKQKGSEAASPALPVPKVAAKEEKPV